MDKVLLLGQPRTGTSYITQLFKRYHERKGRDTEGMYGPQYYNVFKEKLKLLSYLADVEKTQFHLDFLKNSNADIFAKDHLTHYEMNLGIDFDPTEYYQDFYKIKILRRNITETTLSMLIAKNSKMYNTWKAYGNHLVPRSLPSKFTATREDVEHNLKTIQRYSDTISNYNDMDFDQIIYYEDLSGDPSKDQMLFPMLARSPVEDLTVSIVKRGNYSNSIENYEEVLEWINHK